MVAEVAARRTRRAAAVAEVAVVAEPTRCRQAARRRADGVQAAVAVAAQTQAAAARTRPRRRRRSSHYAVLNPLVAVRIWVCVWFWFVWCSLSSTANLNE